MNRRVFSAIIMLALAAVPIPAHSQDAQENPQITSSSSGPISDMMIGSRYGQAELKASALGSSYGFSTEFPVGVGGGFSDGSKNTYRFLNALLGPKGQKVHYRRIGTCCEFETENSPFDGRGLLEVYEITYEGIEEPVRLYFNWYDAGKLLIPVGFKAVK